MILRRADMARLSCGARNPSRIHRGETVIVRPKIALKVRVNTGDLNRRAPEGLEKKVAVSVSRSDLIGSGPDVS